MYGEYLLQGPTNKKTCFWTILCQFLRLMWFSEIATKKNKAEAMQEGLQKNKNVLDTDQVLELCVIDMLNVNDVLCVHRV